MRMLKRFGKPGHQDVPVPRPNPAGFVPAVKGKCDSDASERGQDCRHPGSLEAASAAITLGDGEGTGAGFGG